MSGPPVVAKHPRAGRVEFGRLAVRIRDCPSEPTGLPQHWQLFDSDRPGPGAAFAGPVELHVRLEAGAEHGCVSVGVSNRSGRRLELGSVIVGLVWTGHGVVSHRFLRNGWQSWSYTGARDLGPDGEPPFPSGAWLRGLHHAIGDWPEDRNGWWESDMVSAFGASGGGPVCCVGVLERGESFGVVYLKQRGDALLAEVELRVDATLEPNETRDLESVDVSVGEQASALLERYAERFGRSADARTAHPFLAGWCSWYHFFSEVTESDVLRNLDALVAARDELPIDVVQIDDGYQRQIGDWLETNAGFPRGLAPLAADIRAAGFTAGLWTAPFCVVAQSALFRERPEWLLRDQGAPFRGLLHPVWSPDASVYVLDTSRSDVLGHLKRVFGQLVDWGFHYLKLDFLYAVAMQADAADPGTSRARRLRNGLAAIREGAGPEPFLLGCGCPLGAAVGIVDGMRIGPDVAPYWEGRSDVVIPGIEETVPSTRAAVRSTLCRAWTHRRLWLNDPDCLMARSSDTGLSSDERETLAAAIAITGGMLVFSDDVSSLSEPDRKLIRDTLQIAQRVDRSGLPGLARAMDPLAAETPGEVVVEGQEAAYRALFNPTDATVELSAGIGDAARVLAGRPGRDGRAGVALAPRASALLCEPRKFALAVFCDFDGTFSVQDVGSSLAVRYAGPKRSQAWKRFERGEIEAWDYNLEILDGLAVSLPATDAFLASVELDSGARALLDWCREREVPFEVLSDGFDYNLNRLQAIHGVRFAYRANHLRFENGTWRIRAESRNPACGCGTGICKRAQIDAIRARFPGVTIVHIGNGRVSDTCGALAADVAFAKDSLATELDARGAPYRRFDTLGDVIPQLERLLAARVD